MNCPKCGSSNVTIQAVNEVSLKNAHHGCIWWCFVGWWWIPCKWLIFTLPALLAKLFIPAKQQAKNKTVRKAVCQTCGNMWAFTDVQMNQIIKANQATNPTYQTSAFTHPNNSNNQFSTFQKKLKDTLEKSKKWFLSLERKWQIVTIVVTILVLLILFKACTSSSGTPNPEKSVSATNISASDVL